MFSFFIIASRRDASFVEGYVHPNPYPQDASSVNIGIKNHPHPQDASPVSIIPCRG